MRMWYWPVNPHGFVFLSVFALRVTTSAPDGVLPVSSSGVAYVCYKDIKKTRVVWVKLKKQIALSVTNQFVS